MAISYHYCDARALLSIGRADKSSTWHPEKPRRRRTRYGVTSCFIYEFLAHAVREGWIGPNNADRSLPKNNFGLKKHHAIKLLMATYGFGEPEIIKSSSHFEV
jgi:hypothetical protein